MILDKEKQFKDGKGHNKSQDGIYRDMIKDLLTKKANIPLLRLEWFYENKESFESYNIIQKAIKDKIYKK